MDEKKKKLSGQQGELMRALDITLDDLLANDDGFITENQQDTVMKRQGYQWKQYQILTTVFSLMGLFFIGVGAFNFDKLAPLLFMSFFFLIAGISIGGYWIYQRQTIKKELRGNQLETVQGIAVVVNTLEQSHIEINGLKLHASPDVSRRVQHLQPYIIHYLPDSKVILSMEHISEDSNIREDIARENLQNSRESEQLLVDDKQESLYSTS